MMGHVDKSILSGDGTHCMPVADRSPFVVGIQGFTDENRVQTKGTKFRIYGFPSELSNGAGVDPIGPVRKDHKGFG
jgi:hypothetical protein